MRLVIVIVLLALVLAACQAEDPSEDADVGPRSEPMQAPPAPPTFCGDGVVQVPNERGVEEACDAGARNGEPCEAAYGGSCTYCTSTCEEETINGGYCGDGTCQSYEDHGLCADDCDRVYERPEEDRLVYYLGEADLNGTPLIVEEDIDIGSSFTIAAWVRRDEQTTGYIVSRDDIGADTRGGYSLSIDRGGFMRYETNDLSDATSSLGDVPVGEWVHVAVTYDRTSVPQLTFFIDGEAGRVANGITQPHDLSTSLIIGRQGPNPPYPFIGSIRDLRIYDRTLAPEAVEELSAALP